MRIVGDPCESGCADGTDKVMFLFHLVGLGDVGPQFNFGPHGILNNGSGGPLGALGVGGQHFDGGYNGFFGSTENGLLVLCSS